MRSKNMFWAIFFLVIGAILLIQNVFKIDLPILKILFGVFLIYLGVKVIAGSFNIRVSGFKVDRIATATETIFSNSQFKVKTEAGGVNNKFTTAFGNSVLDLSGLTPEDLEHEYKIENAFGRTEVLTNPGTPIIAKVEAGFASVQIRDQKMTSFGDAEMRSPSYVEGQPALKLKIEAAFGSVEVK